jgi:hypothetical protein
MTTHWAVSKVKIIGQMTKLSEHPLILCLCQKVGFGFCASNGRYCLHHYDATTKFNFEP